MNNVQPSALNDTVKTRKATISISVGIGDARSQQPRCRGRGKQTVVTNVQNGITGVLDDIPNPRKVVAWDIQTL